MGILEYILLILVVFGGAFVQRVTGFGMGIFCMLFLPYFMPSHGVTVATLGIIGSIGAVYNAVKNRKDIRLKLMLPLVCSAMAVIPLAVHLSASLPQSIIEAGHIDGASQLQTFFQIVLPLSKPICAVIAIFAVNAAWSDFLLPYLVLRGAQKQTVMVRLFVFSTEQTVNADAMMRSVVFSMIPPIILFFIFQKQLTENAVSVGIKG